jgi:hypothetical protein
MDTTHSRGGNPMTTLTNSYHDTTATTRKTRDEIDAILDTHPANRTPADRQWLRRMHDRLCGSSTCDCGNEAGERYAAPVNTSAPASI